MPTSQRLAIWINAFIPRDVPGCTVEIQQGDNRGKTAIPLPWYARFPLNTFRPSGTGYLTDQRSFSSKVTASARMQSLISCEVSPPRDLRGLHQTSGTTEVNIDSGATQRNEDADMSRCHHSQFYSVGYDLPFLVYRDQGTPKGEALTHLLSGRIRDGAKPFTWTAPEARSGLMVNVTGAASDPLVHGAPDIDYDVSFVIGIDQNANSLIVGCLGFVDAFPAFESYTSYFGETKTLFILPPPPGNTPLNLIGGANRSVVAAVKFDLRASQAYSQRLPHPSYASSAKTAPSAYQRPRLG
jgi:hypothetical protein